ncbi:long-chain-fatty-acid--CoA ligase [Sphingobium cupriresistens]|uniref:AMP-dependent synthetase n=1 Tax=Sphingobium cupriresistens LL01 TaxID=1420583 RepID=A0A0J7Y055_9SPHN|nr:long-chain fatty acid--CoA ligase [Sphingobium cupriresistens]KMS56803.1 AMP-dependent synthetase [Sphingobium cupriresistens LL01]
MWLADILFESASRHCDKLAIIFENRRLTYGALRLEVERAAAGLQALDIGPSKRVAVMLENGLDFVVAYYATLATGASVVTVSALLTVSEASYVLKDSTADLLIGGGRVWDTAQAAADGAGLQAFQLADLAEGLTYICPTPPDGRDEAVIMYTSGTTGKPKGAILTHDNLTMNALVSVGQGMFNLSPEDVVLCCIPLFHASGQSCLLNTGLLAGATVVIMRQFAAQAVLDVMRLEKVTFFLGVPTMYVGLLSLVRPNKAELPHWRVAVSGGAPIPVAVLEEVERLFEVDIYEGYGLTETSPTACFNQPDFERRPGTIGKAIWGVQCEVARIELEDRIELLAADEVGELVVRGHNVFAGYLNQADATRACMVDGWFRTGDIATKDEDGYVRIVDRKKDMIIRGGFNVYSREIEEVLSTHPAIALAAVVGRPDDLFGEEIVAVVQLHRDMAGISSSDMVEWAKRHLAKYKYPREFVFVETIPLGPSGKILKRELAELVARLSTASP